MRDGQDLGHAGAAVANVVAGLQGCYVLKVNQCTLGGG